MTIDSGSEPIGSASWIAKEYFHPQVLPRFVCRMTDARYLVVEYIGLHLWGAPDAQEKRAVGKVWEERSAGKCLFVMPEGPDFGAIEAKYRLEK